MKQAFEFDLEEIGDLLLAQLLRDSRVKIEDMKNDKYRINVSHNGPAIITVEIKDQPQK